MIRYLVAIALAVGAVAGVEAISGEKLSAAVANPRLGPVTLGMTRASVVAILGRPRKVVDVSASIPAGTPYYRRRVMRLTFDFRNASYVVTTVDGRAHMSCRRRHDTFESRSLLQWVIEFLA